MADPLTITRPEFVKGVRAFQMGGYQAAQNIEPEGEQYAGWLAASVDQALHGDFYYINRCIEAGDDWDLVVATDAYAADYPGTIARDAKMTKRYAWTGDDGCDRELFINMQPLDWGRERRADDAARKLGWPGTTA